MSDSLYISGRHTPTAVKSLCAFLHLPPFALLRVESFPSLSQRGTQKAAHQTYVVRTHKPVDILTQNFLMHVG